MHRFYCPDLNVPISDGQPLSAPAELDREQTYHARKVLRMGPGSELELFNGKGVQATGVVRGSAKDLCFQIEVVSSTYGDELTPWIDLAVSIPKGARADQMIEQASQLGASRVIPLRTERSVVQPRDAKLSRFGRIAIESAKQCKRAHLMQIGESTAFEALIEAPYDAMLIAMPAGLDNARVVDALRGAGRVLILIGPEGGFTDLETHIAMTGGCLRWQLGPHVMRIETAAMAALSVARYVSNEA